MGTSIEIKSTTSGAALPIARWVYAVQDASDVTRLGGTSGRAYSTITDAYNAADALQISLGGSNYVGIRVIGRLTGAAGTVTLSANWNTRVALFGDSPDLSQIVSIVLSNANGNGYDFTNIYMSDLKVTTGIYTTATGATGDAGDISILAKSVAIGLLHAHCTNASNTTGSTGNIAVTDFYGSSLIGTVSNNLTAAGTTGNTGSLTLQATGMLRVGAIDTVGNTQPGTAAGAVTLINVEAASMERYTEGPVTIRGCKFFGICGIWPKVQPTPTLWRVERNTFLETVSFQVDPDVGSGSDLFFVGNIIGSEESGFNGSLIEGFRQVYIKDSVFLASAVETLVVNNCLGLGIFDSTFHNVDDNTVQPPTGSFNCLSLSTAGTFVDVRIIGSSFNAGLLGIDADAAVTVGHHSTYIESGVGVNVTLSPL